MSPLEPNPKIVALLAKAGGAVAIYNEIKMLGIADECKSVGVHRANRDGAMVSGRGCIKVLQDINAAGGRSRAVERCDGFRGAN